MVPDRDELLRRIRLGEDTSLELKAVQLRGGRLVAPRRDDLADEIAAIANTASGAIVFGVDDKTRTATGMGPDEIDVLERVLFELCSDAIVPPVLFLAHRVELSAGDDPPRGLLYVEIPRSLFVHKSPGGYFRRQGSSKREMPPDVLARLFQQRSQARVIRFDEQAVPGTSEGDLAEPLWRRFLGKSTGEAPQALRKLHVLVEDDLGVERASVAGVLMCSHTPATWLPGAFILAVRYRGQHPDASFQIDAREIVGPLDVQIADAIAFVRRNMTIRARKSPGRIDLPQFSERAVFEAIVNAVAHRDYSVHGSKIRLFMFDDRLELYSPGALPNTLSTESMALRQATRNELITSLLAKCPVPPSLDQADRGMLMDKRGEGVPIIYEESRRLSGRDPEYRVLDDAEVMLTIWSAEAAE